MNLHTLTTPERLQSGLSNREVNGDPVAAPVVPTTSGNGRLALAAVAMFLLPWAVWGSAIAQAHDLISWRLPQGIALWVLTPSIVVGVLLVGGRAALVDLTRRVLSWRGPWWAYAAAVGVPVLIGAATLALTRVAGLPGHLGENEGLTGCLVYFSYAIGLFLLTEEAGWVGVLMPRLESRLRPLAASLVLGALWGLWHVPLLNVPGEADHGLPFLAFLLLIVPTRVLMSTVVHASRGGVLVAAVFHAAFNATLLYVGVVGTDHALIWTAGVLTTVLAVFATVATRGRLLSPALAA